MHAQTFTYTNFRYVGIIGGWMRMTYEMVVLNEDLEDERDMDQIMVDCMFAAITNDTRESISSQRKLPHDQGHLGFQTHFLEFIAI